MKKKAEKKPVKAPNGADPDDSSYQQPQLAENGKQEEVALDQFDKTDAILDDNQQSWNNALKAESLE